MTTQDWNAIPDEEFRRTIADFCARNIPAELRGLPNRVSWVKAKPWYLILSRAGLLAPAWPVKYGGMGLSPNKHIIYLEELDRAGAPQMPDHGLITVGPALIMHGSEEQKRKYLPRILSGEDVWTQGFSEPNAGSDLASLRTEGRVEGDEIIINGQKIWTSWAREANMLFILVRTNKQVKKQAGISFVLTHLPQPGITVRPIRMIDGRDAFNQTFYDNARAKLEDVVGGLDKGWTVAQSLLGAERLWAGSPRHALKFLAVLERTAEAAGRADDPVYLDRHAQFVMDVEDLGCLYRRAANSMGEGGRGYEVSMLKIWQTELSQRIMQFALDIAADAGALGLGAAPEDPLAILHSYIESRPPTIYGGTVQIQRNILSKNVLRLPS
jgi:alkylation response protein AidB-like acyl-CoA dehydrogenase